MTRDEAIPMLCVACGVSPASADINVTALYSIVDKLIAAERERLDLNAIHTCHAECQNPFCVRVKEAVEHEREACALVAESYEPTCDSCPSGVANAIRGRS